MEHGITTFDNNLREYEACGGKRPNDEDLKSDLLDSLPIEVRENLLWRTVKRDETYDSFRNHVRMQANSVLYHRGKLKTQVNAVDIEQHATLENSKDSAEEMLNALMKKFDLQRRGDGNRTAGRTRWNESRPERPGGGDRDRPPRRCINCGSDKHIAKDCNKPPSAPANVRASSAGSPDTSAPIAGRAYASSKTMRR